jgi:pimeloyl-ACP methyl ester carboxylesterase
MSLADELRLPKVFLVGWSFGGMIAQQAVLDHPERVEGLVLAGTAAVGELSHRFETWTETLSRISSEGITKTLDRTVRTWFACGESHPSYLRCRQACDGASEDACKGAIKAMRAWTSRHKLSRVKQPTLIIVGDRDRSTPLSDSLDLLEGIPGAQLCVLPGCAHGAHMERPEYFNRIVTDFLSNRPVSDGLFGHNHTMQEID